MKRKLDILLMVMFLFGSMIFLCPIFGQIKEVEEDDRVYTRMSAQVKPLQQASGLVEDAPSPAAAAVQTVLPLLLVNRWLGLTGLFAMGLLMYLLNTPVQVHSLGLAEAEYPAAASLCASVQPVSYNFGIAVGSFAGSLVQDAWGLRLLGVPAAVFALLSLWQCKGLLRSIQRGKTSR